MKLLKWIFILVLSHNIISNASEQEKKEQKDENSKDYEQCVNQCENKIKPNTSSFNQSIFSHRDRTIYWQDITEIIKFHSCAKMSHRL